MNSIMAFLFLLATSFAFANGIEISHLKCKADSDCRLVIIGCACIHNSTCLGPEDKTNGIVAGVSKEFLSRYKDLSKCTDSERRQCSMAGACAQRGQWLPKCEQQKCTVVFK